MLRNLGSETEFLKNWHEAKLKQWKETHELPYSILIRSSKSQSVDTMNNAVNQAVRESSENYKGMMMQKIFKVLRVM